MSNTLDEQIGEEPTGFLHNVNLVFLTTLTAYGIAFFYSILLARELGPDGRGAVALYTTGVNLGFLFFGIGIGATIVYNVARRELTPRESTEAGLSVTLAAMIFTAIFIGLLAIFANDTIHDRGVPYWLAIITVPGIINNRAVEATLRAQGRFVAMNVLEIIWPVTILVGLVAVEVTSGLTVRRAVFVWSASFAPALAIGYMMVGVDAWPRRLAGIGLLRRILGFGFQSQLGNLVQALNYRLDSYLLLLFVNTAAVGFYAVAVSISEGIWFVANSVAIVFSTHLTAGHEEYRTRTTPLVSRNTLLISGAGALVAAAMSPFVIPAIYGHDFKDSVVPFLWLLPGTVALAGAKVISVYVFSRGRPLINGAIALVALAVTVLADLVLIPAFEVSGAAAGATLGYCVSLVLTCIAYRRLSGASITDALLPRPSDAVYYIDGLRSLTRRLPIGRAARTRLGEP